MSERDADVLELDVPNVVELHRPVTLYTVTEDGDGYVVRSIQIAPNATIVDVGWAFPIGNRWAAITPDHKRVGMAGKTFVTGPDASCDSLQLAAQLLVGAHFTPVARTISVDAATLHATQAALRFQPEATEATITQLRPREP